MRKILLIPVSLFLLIGILAFASSINVTKSRFDDGYQPKEIDLKNFTKIGLAISADVYLTQADEFKIRVDASDNDLDKIEFSVDNSMLRIKSKDFFSGNLRDVDIYITCPVINQLNVSGSGEINMENDLNTKDLELNVSGSGDIMLLGLKADDVSANVAGSGSIAFNNESRAQHLAVKISGSGEVHADKLSVEDSNIQISGSGDCETYTTGHLEARISGSGSVYYKGNPTVNAKTVGSGKVRSF